MGLIQQIEGRLYVSARTRCRGQPPCRPSSVRRQGFGRIFGHRHRAKELGRIQVVFAGLIDHANQGLRLRAGRQLAWELKADR